MKGAIPLKTFTLRFHKKYPQTCEVRVFGCWRDMDAWRRYMGLDGKCRAYVVPVRVLRPKGEKPHPLICEIGFYLASLRMGVITHECVHAGLRFMEATKHSKTAKNEELYAFVVGNIARQIVNKTRGLT